MSTEINIIVAYAKNRVIGKDGKIPWHLPEDMKYFRERTMNCPVVMGRKTYDSLSEKYKPLPGRYNIVLTSKNVISDKYNLIFLRGIDDVLKLVSHYKTCWIIGGEKVYNLFLSYADKVYATECDFECDGDAFFPVLNGDWKKEIIHKGNRFNFSVFKRSQ